MSEHTRINKRRSKNETVEFVVDKDMDLKDPFDLSIYKIRR